MAGDDTQTRVVEVKRALKEGTIPWQDYQDKSSCETLVKHGGKKELDALTTRIGLHFDFVSQSKITATAKRQLNTTALSAPLCCCLQKAQGLSLRAIARTLSDLKIPTKLKGKAWHPEMVSRILERFLNSGT